MPYVEQDQRQNLNTLVEIMNSIGISANGDLNYVLFKYCKNHVRPSYNNYKNFLGELNECSEEIRRRLLAKYEDKKIEENGDVE